VDRTEHGGKRLRPWTSRGDQRTVDSMKAVTCYLRRHTWRHQRNPDMGGPQADYEVCTRCGKERNSYDKKDGTGIGAAGAS